MKKLFSNLFLIQGGFPVDVSISNRTLNHFNKPFSGCLQGVQISNFNGQMSPSSMTQPALYTAPNIQDFSVYEGENIGECELFDEFVNTV